MEVIIDKLGINGEGVFKLTDGENSGKVGFVSFALPNELVEVEIMKQKSSFCEAKLKNIIKSSSERVCPKCKYFYNCGGCDLQHISDDLQLQFKKEKIHDTLKKIAKIDIDINNIIRLNSWNYRNKMVFPFAAQDNQLIIGMFQKNSHNVIEIDNCLIADENINLVLKITTEYFRNSNKYLEMVKNKILKYLVVRYINYKYLITIVASKKIDIDDYYNYLSGKFENIGLSLIIGDSDNEILSGKYYHINGLKSLDIEEFGIKYSVDNRGFLQVNNDVKKSIYLKILECVDKGDIVIDSYSGAGLLSSIIAKKCKKVIGIEINSSSSKSAKLLAKNNNLHNTMFYNDDVKNRISECLDNNPDSVLILDPARSGCEDVVLEKILASNLPKKIIYLSCNVATLARDLLKLKSMYDISFIEGYDMFPNTKHIETLVCLQRRV